MFSQGNVAWQRTKFNWDWGPTGCCVRASQRTYALLIPRSGLVQSYLLEARVIIASYNQHIGSFLPSLLVGLHTTKV
jgi:hypothetical protein